MSQVKKEKNLQKKIEDLIRENKNLRKKLSQLRKVANNEIHYGHQKKEVVEANRKEVKECSYCRGEIKKISVYNLDFEVCQTCKTRKRIK